jgi:hypothetical protein
MSTRVEAIPVRFVSGDLHSQREAFLMMFRLVIGHAQSSGEGLIDIAARIGVPVAKLGDWIAGKVRDFEVPEMSRRCIAFARALGLELRSEALAQ